LILSDAGDLIRTTNVSDITLTIPTDASVAYDIGEHIDFLQSGAGNITFVGAAGVTVNTSSSLTTRAQNSSATLVKYDTNVWAVVGDLENPDEVLEHIVTFTTSNSATSQVTAFYPDLANRKILGVYWNNCPQGVAFNYTVGYFNWGGVPGAWNSGSLPTHTPVNEYVKEAGVPTGPSGATHPYIVVDAVRGAGGAASTTPQFKIYYK